jgi:hypothetical protein
MEQLAHASIQKSNLGKLTIYFSDSRIRELTRKVSGQDLECVETGMHL